MQHPPLALGQAKVSSCALSHCIAEVGERGQLQHSPALGWDRQVSMVVAFSCSLVSVSGHSILHSQPKSSAHTQTKHSPALLQQSIHFPIAFLRQVRVPCPRHVQLDAPWSPGPGGRGGWYSWASQDLPIKKTVLERPHPGHCTDSRMKHNPKLSVKKALLFRLEL